MRGIQHSFALLFLGGGRETGAPVGDDRKQDASQKKAPKQQKHAIDHAIADWDLYFAAAHRGAHATAMPPKIPNSWRTKKP